MSYRATILGCGSSGGVPRIGIGWGACDPNESRNVRRRCSLLVERLGQGSATQVLIDTSPDLRAQLIDLNLNRLDAVLFTHEHADHIHGIDDIRPIVQTMRRRVPAYADAATLALLKTRFSYCFEAPAGSDYPPILDAHVFAPLCPIRLEGPGGAVEALPIPLIHGSIEAYGFRFGTLTYAPDLNAVPETSWQAFQDLDVLIIDALRDKPHPSHFSLQDALNFIEAVKPRRAVLTNMHIDLDYQTLLHSLPESIVPAYDGMVIEWQD